MVLNEWMNVQSSKMQMLDLSLMMSAGRKTKRRRRVEMQMQILAVILLDLLERMVQLMVKEMWCG